jgi:hypothetical protein
MKSSDVLNHPSWNKILPRWSAESTDRLLATDGLTVRGAEEEDEDEEEEDKNEKDDDSEDDGYSE